MDEIRNQWVRSQEELQFIKNENENLKRQVLESSKAGDQVSHRVEETEEEVVSTSNEDDLIEPFVAVVSVDSSDGNDTRSNNEQRSLDSLQTTVFTPHSETAIPPRSSPSVATDATPMTSYDKISTHKCPSNIAEVHPKMVPISTTILSNDKNKENTVPRSHPRFFRPALL